ncbi:MAG: hypothetical protein ACOX8R_02495 [Bacillota bacterium]|jgi:hypothetical protein
MKYYMHEGIIEGTAIEMASMLPLLAETMDTIIALKIKEIKEALTEEHETGGTK